MTQLALGSRIITASCMQHAFILTSFVHELQNLPRYHMTPYAELDSWQPPLESVRSASNASPWLARGQAKP